MPETCDVCLKMLKQLDEKLKTRQRWLTEERPPYPLHEGHWSRDLVTAMAVIEFCETGRTEDRELAERLLRHMPEG